MKEYIAVVVTATFVFQLLIIKKLNKIMATSDQFKAALARIETATTAAGTAVTAVGVRITALEEAIKNMGLSQAQEDELLAQTEGLAPNLETLATALTAMGKPTDPIPDPVPDPVPPVPPVE